MCFNCAFARRAGAPRCRQVLPRTALVPDACLLPAAFRLLTVFAISVRLPFVDPGCRVVQISLGHLQGFALADFAHGDHFR